MSHFIGKLFLILLAILFFTAVFVGENSLHVKGNMVFETEVEESAERQIP